jgi:hypothetical protein
LLHFAAGFGATAGAASGLLSLQNEVAAPFTNTARDSLTYSNVFWIWCSL